MAANPPRPAVRRHGSPRSAARGGRARDTCPPPTGGGAGRSSHGRWRSPDAPMACHRARREHTPRGVFGPGRLTPRLSSPLTAMLGAKSIRRTTNSIVTKRLARYTNTGAFACCSERVSGDPLGPGVLKEGFNSCYLYAQIFQVSHSAHFFGSSTTNRCPVPIS